MKNWNMEGVAKGVLSTCALSLFLAAGTVGAQGMTDEGMAQDQGMAGGMAAQMPTFSELDTDGDGMLSKDEANAYFDQRFSVADQDQSGTLDQSEFAQFEIPAEGVQPPSEMAPPADSGAMPPSDTQ